jgi:ankyrin repeat protein
LSALAPVRACAALLFAASALFAVAQAPLAPRVEDVPSSPLAEAAQRGDAATVRALLDAGGIDVDAPSRDGTPALHWAVRAGDRDTAERLVAAGADVNSANRYGVRPLHLAIAADDVALTRRLLKGGADATALDRTGEPPLLLAARIGNVELVQALLESGAAVDARDEHFGQTALMVAAREGRLETARALLAAGAAVDAQTKPETPPRFIPPSESPEGLSRGAGIIRAGWPDGRGKRYPAGGSKTPLLYATREGHLDVARLLLERGANIELADGNGVTPLINAIVNASIIRVNPTGTSDHLKIAQLLLDAGANVNAADWYGETPLWAAVDVRNLELGRDGNDRGVRDEAFALVERLLEAGADPNARTREYPHERRFILVVVGSVSWVDLTGQTPFLRAAAAGDVDVMKLLLEHGADPSIATNAGTTPLMVAAGVNWAVAETFDLGNEALLEAVKLAHALGNDVNAVNSMGIAAIHGAANRGANDVIEYLAANGARLDVADAQGRTPLDWAKGVFLATHPPAPKPDTIALLERLLEQQRGSAQ